MTDFGFVIVRYVNSVEANEYWKSCYLAIRKLYPLKKILIVDDCSDPQYLTEFETSLCDIVKGEFPRRGELLGYYYFHKLKPFAKAVIIHDNVFINRCLDFDSVENIKFLWSFDHQYDDVATEIELLVTFDTKISDLYSKKSLWFGCYGVMSIIAWNFLNELDLKFNLFSNLLPVVVSRKHRMALERIFACVCTVAENNLSTLPHLIGDIHEYRWGRNISYNEYLQGKNSDMPLVKILVGR